MKVYVRSVLLAGVTLVVGLLPAGVGGMTIQAATAGDTVAIVNTMFGDARQCVTDINAVYKDENTFGTGSFHRSAAQADGDAGVKDCVGGYRLVKAVGVPDAIPDALVVRKLQVQVEDVTVFLAVASSDLYHQGKGDVARGTGKGTQQDFVTALRGAAAALNRVNTLTNQVVSDLHLKSNRALFKLGGKL